VVGNSPATAVEPGHWRLGPGQPLSTYFVTLVAGDYVSVTDTHDGITLGLHTRASLVEHLQAEAGDILDVTRRCFDRYHELFGVRYPFGEYHQAFVPDFNAGAMENPGCVTLRDQFVFRSAATAGQRCERATTIAHEMAHMWFGDLVTMRWWDDLWLNESFAEFLGTRVTAEVTGYPAWTEFGIVRKDWGAVADQSPATHPVAGNGAADAEAALTDFDGISYAKGAAVLRQLATHLGDPVFFGGVRDHFDRHRFGNADLSDLLGAWQSAGARDLQSWAGQWLRTSGLDRLTGSVDGPDGRTVTVTRQSPDGSRRPHTVRVRGFAADGASTVDEQRTLAGDRLQIEADAATCLVVADGGDDTWATCRFGPDGWERAARVLPTLSDAATRVVVHNAIRDGVRAAELDPAQALTYVLEALRVEADEQIVAEMVHFCLQTLAGPYAPPRDRAARRQQIHSTARTLLSRATAGSDAQLVAARAVIAASDDAGEIQQWLDGLAVPAGVVVDADLRWVAVLRAAALGSLSDAGLAAEMARDRSTSAQVYAARARALRPDAAAKARAWTLLSEPGDTSAYELYATAEGFFDPARPELTADYVARYFAEMPATAAFRPGWSGAQVVARAFPAHCVDTATLALAEAAVGAAAGTPGVHRALVDATAALGRAHASLARFAGGA
jgi:aminopeptidase N